MSLGLSCAHFLRRVLLMALIWRRLFALATNFATSRSTKASIRSCCGFGNSGRNLGIPKSSFCPSHASSTLDDSSIAAAHFMASCSA